MNNQELERMLLGKLLASPKEIYSEYQSLLSPLMFDDIQNQAIFKAAIKLLEKGDEVDLMSISKECGGMAPYIAELVSDSVSQYFKVPFIVRELLDHSKRKMLTQLVIDVNDDLVSAKPIDAIIGRINHVYSAVNNLDPEGDEEDFSGQAELFLEEIIKRCETDGITGITTGFKSLDDFTNGWQPTDLVIFGAASSMGKTSFALSTAMNAAVSGTPVAVFSYEMSAVQMIQRLVSIDSGVKQKWLNQGALDPKEMNAVRKSVEYIKGLPITIDDCNNTSLAYLVSKIKYYAVNKGTKLVYVDYLQLVSARTGKGSSREQEVAKVARALKNIAKELDICVIALSQLNRGVGMRASSKPTLSDLRESGEIEQAADVVALIYRPEYYGLYELEDGETTHGLAQIIFAKGRNIGVGEVNLRFIADLTKFEEYESDKVGA